MKRDNSPPRYAQPAAGPLALLLVGLGVFFCALEKGLPWGLTITFFLMILPALGFYTKGLLGHRDWCVLITFMAVSGVVVTALPFYALISGQYDRVYIDADPAAWARTMVIELSFLLCWVAGFIAWFSISKGKKMAASFLLERGSRPYIVNSLLAAGVISTIVMSGSVVGIYGGQQLLALEAVARAGESTQVALLSVFAIFVVPCVCVKYLEAPSRASKAVWLALFGLICILQYWSAQRAVTILNVAMLLFGAFQQRVRILYLAIFAAVPAFIVIGTSHVIELYREEMSQVGRGYQAGERSQSFDSAMAGTSWAANLESFFMRIELTQAGSFLLLDADSSGGVGFRPYEGLLYLYVPRVLFPRKPVVGSATGDAEGMANFVIPRMRGQVTNSNSMSIGATAYWRLERTGVILIGLFSGFVVAWVTSVLNRGGILGSILLLQFLAYTMLFYSDDLWALRWVLLFLVPVLLISLFLQKSIPTGPYNRARVGVIT